MLAAGSEVLRLWSPSSTSPFYSLELPPKSVNDVCFSANSRLLYLGTNTESLVQLDLYKGGQTMIETDSPSITKIACSPNGTYIATGSRAGVVTVLSNHEAEAPEAFRAHHIQITSLVFTNDSTALIAGDRYGQISIGSFKRSRLPGWSSRRGQIFDISSAYHSDVIGISCNTGLAFYDLIDSKIVSAKSIKSQAISYSPHNDNLIAVATTESELLFYDPSADKIVTSIQFSGPVTALDFKFDGVTIAAAVADHGIKLIDIRRLDQAVSLDRTKTVNALRFQPALLDEPISSEFIQFRSPEIVRPEPTPEPKIESKPEPKAQPVQPEEPEIDLDTIRSTLHEIETDVKLHEPTLDPRNAALLKTARSLAKPASAQVPGVAPDEMNLITGYPKRRPGTPREELALSPQAREISEIVSRYFKKAMVEVQEEMVDAVNTVHLDVLTRISEISREIENL
jgi:hypothetical protein